MHLPHNDAIHIIGITRKILGQDKNYINFTCGQKLLLPFRWNQGVLESWKIETIDAKIDIEYFYTNILYLFKNIKKGCYHETVDFDQQIIPYLMCKIDIVFILTQYFTHCSYKMN